MSKKEIKKYDIDFKIHEVELVITCSEYEKGQREKRVGGVVIDPATAGSIRIWEIRTKKPHADISELFANGVTFEQIHDEVVEQIEMEAYV